MKFAERKERERKESLSSYFIIKAEKTVGIYAGGVGKNFFNRGKKNTKFKKKKKRAKNRSSEVKTELDNGVFPRH